MRLSDKRLGRFGRRNHAKRHCQTNWLPIAATRKVVLRDYGVIRLSLALPCLAFVVSLSSLVDFGLTHAFTHLMCGRIWTLWIKQ